MDFVALDVETANPDLASICQIGVAHFVGGELVRSAGRYVDPQDWFDEFNVSIHGIDERTVRGAPTFPELHEWLMAELAGKVVVTHTRFDVTSIGRACEAAGFPPPAVQWLDSAAVSRRTWDWCARSGYGLGPLCEKFDIAFEHHDAEQDAIAAGRLLIVAMREAGRALGDCLELVRRPITPPTDIRITTDESCQANPEGEYFGQTIVFTGALRVTRFEAAQLAARHGFAVADGVSKKIDVLVVGDQDVSKLAGHDKSSKHRKAEELQAKGAEIRILKESDFERLLSIG